MTPNEEIRIHIVACRNGHRIKLEILSSTPNMIQKVKCPTCGTEMVSLIGKLLSVSPADSEPTS